MLNRFFVSRKEYEELLADYITVSKDVKKLLKGIEKMHAELYQKDQEIMFYKMVAGYERNEIIYPNSKDL